jgi:pimeloyl-ACP methyl ester carboxylesterase
VLLLHGLAGNALIWRDVAERLRALVPRRRIVAIETRDGGQTDHPIIGYGLPEYVADVLAVGNEIGGGQLALVGHSRGGLLAASIAALHPDIVDRIVMIDPARLTFRTSQDAEASYGRVFGGLGPFASSDAAIDWARSQEPNARWSRTRIDSFLGNFVALPNGTLVGRLPRTAVEQLRVTRAEFETVPFELIRAPTLLITASGLGEVHVTERLVYAARIPACRMVRLPGTHFLHTDAPDEVAALIAAHLSGTRGTPTA